MRPTRAGGKWTRRPEQAGDPARQRLVASAEQRHTGPIGGREARASLIDVRPEHNEWRFYRRFSVISYSDCNST
jgi:hypothetical protein